MDIIITIFYWLVLYEGCDTKESAKCFYNFWNHIWPMIVVIIDFTTSAVPIMKSQVVLIIIGGLIYNLVNFTITKSLGEPIYQQLKWKQPEDLFLPNCIMIVTIGLFYLIEFVQRLKLKASGYHVEVNILQGKDIQEKDNSLELNEI